LLFLDFIVLDLERLEYLPPVVGRPGGGPGGRPGGGPGGRPGGGPGGGPGGEPGGEPGAACALFAARRRFMRDSYTAADACDAADAAGAADAAASSRGDAAFFGIIYIYYTFSHLKRRLLIKLKIV